MKLVYLPLTLCTLLSSLCIGNAAHIRGAARWNQAVALPTPTHAAPANYPTGTHNAAPKWYPEDGAGIEIYNTVTPGQSQPYTSNGTCVDLLDYKSSYIVDAFRLAPGIACQFYYLPDCQQPIPSEGNGKVKNEGFWNASMIWQPPTFSSFQCWPKACEQPVPPIDYAVVATATFTCAHEPTMIPVGFTKANYQIVLSSWPTAAISSPYVAPSPLYGGGSPQPYYQQGCEEQGGTNC